MAIKEHGPISARELADLLGISYSYARATVSYYKKKEAIHVHSYRRDEDGGKLYPRGLYVLGTGKDASKIPPLTRQEYTKRYRHNKKNACQSVFMLGVPVDHRRMTNRKRPDVVERLKKQSSGT